MKKILLLILLVGVYFKSDAQQFWGGGGGLWTSAGWSNSNSAPYDQAYISGSAVNFNVDGTISGSSGINFSSINATKNMTLLNPTTNTMSTGGNIATITVSAGKTLDFSTQPLSNAAGTGLIKNGNGTFALTGNTYPSGFILNAGTVVARGVNAFGQSTTNNLTINGGTIAGDGGLTFNANKFASITINADFTLGSTVAPASSTATLSFASPVNLGALTKTITLNGTGTNTFSGVVSSTGAGLNIGNGSTGTLVLSGANTYSGETTLSGGTLTLGAANVIPDASIGIIFNGGTLKTGAFDEIYPPLYLDDNSTIILNATVQSHNFSTSNAVGFAPGKTLTITGWAGGYNSTSGTKGKIFVGTDATGLTASQLQQIKFFNGTVNYDATILSTGEVVPSTITVLPISLTSFTAKTIDKTILLNWATASEKNNQHFEVLRSADGKSFKSIATVNGTGNSDTEKSYSFVDENPYAGANYYKLKQTDFDGATATSTVISANAKIEGVKLSAYASSNSVIVNINSPNQTDGKIALFDMNGRKLESKNLVLNKGYNEINFGKFIVPGTYFVNLMSGGKSISYKFIK
ncbi:MAG TPA: T9SS type A sorting domain-containing protein [Pelobium sp.]|nr:T9SS type A sorting domain-containing protein [Pelobium sp.]